MRILRRAYFYYVVAPEAFADGQRELATVSQTIYDREKQ